MINIVYEDNHLLVVEKPINIIVQEDNTKDKDLLSMLKEYLKEKYNKPGNVYLGLIHRLDRPVSGIMVFAKTSKAAGRLSESIRERKFEKIYYAVVNGIFLDKTGILENYIIKKSNKLGNIAQIVFENTKNSKFAKLKYEVIEENIIKNLSLVKVELETGRFHQIRVQFSNIGHTIYGDRKYGNYIKYDKSDILLALFSKSLKFPHLVKDEIVFIEADLPNYKPYNLFS